MRSTGGGLGGGGCGGKQRVKISKWCKKIGPSAGRLLIIAALNRNLKITFMLWLLLQEKTIALEQ